MPALLSLQVGMTPPPAHHLRSSISPTSRGVSTSASRASCGRDMQMLENYL